LVQVAGRNCRSNVSLQHPAPKFMSRSDGVAVGPTATVELARSGSEEASAREGAIREVVKPGIADRKKAGQAGLGFGGRLPDLPPKDGDGGIKSSELELLLGAEMAEHAGLAHAEVGGQAADGQSLKALDR
jgi:hypothetical protein